MIYLGDSPIGVNHPMSIDWDGVATGTVSIVNNIVLSDTVETIANDAFVGLSMSTIVGNEVKTVGNRAFLNCSKLKTVSFPKLKTINDNSFQYTSSLKSITTDETEKFGARSLNASGITCIVAPKLKEINTDALYNINALAYLDIGNKQINNFVGLGYVFDHNATCITILRYNYVLPAASGWFYNGCFLKKSGTPSTLYVWQDLISAYENHSVWGPLLSSNNNQILPIEGSEYETHYADGREIV